MSNMIQVNISDLKLAKAPDELVTYALGSCVGICMYDSVKKIGGLSHIMLPNCPDNAPGVENRMKYADTAIPMLFNHMIGMGCQKNRLTAKIIGGARMFSVLGDSVFGNIGERNILAVKQTLSLLHIPIAAEDTGFDYGRTVYFYPNSGTVEVKSFTHGVKLL